ncbi:hypothetical protein ACLGIH_33240 [Streptomyces sp. HMX87]|uniref:hypothetical protein n=1 Tax=Streptomyces sp. HMX87 TaxID=3390849 RepID=UPI003A89D7E6
MDRADEDDRADGVQGQLLPRQHAVHDRAGDGGVTVCLETSPVAGDFRKVVMAAQDQQDQALPGPADQKLLRAPEPGDGMEAGADVFGCRWQ